SKSSDSTRIPTHTDACSPCSPTCEQARSARAHRSLGNLATRTKGRFGERTSSRATAACMPIPPLNLQGARRCPRRALQRAVAQALQTDLLAAGIDWPDLEVWSAAPRKKPSNLGRFE